jgi:hypothetical protein
MENRGHIRVVQRGRRPGFAQEPLPGDLAAQLGRGDDLQRDEAAQVRVEGFVGNPHRSAPQLMQRAVLAEGNFKMLEADRLGHEDLETTNGD